MTSKRSILLVIHGLTAGGAERVLTMLANAWAARGDEVTIATLSSAEETPFFPLDPRIRRLALGADGNPGAALRALGALGRNVARVRGIRRAIRVTRPDVVMSYMNVTNVLSIAAAAGTGVPVVATEHIDPSQQQLNPLWTTLRRWAYPHAGRLAVLNDRVLEYFPPDIRAKSVVVPNPVIEPAGGPAVLRAAADPGPRTIVAMGRMTAQKGFDLLLDAFAQVASRHPAWSLEIWGEGPVRADLIERARALGLDDRVRLPGRTADAYGVLRAADLYVLSSRFEGFPMVLCEAMATGLPVVAFDCRTGPREIVRDGIDGVLVPPGDVAALADALDRLLGDPALRARLASRAPELVERFSLERVLARWDEVFAGVAD
jgi:GalNAc-alpha-(1->4)-GalNAc-alpha-(1->3)-diNAcBac-PP-undecaprenol alpha-1,4-N-acetyl-D-galactosaminyltransferase